MGIRYEHGNRVAVTTIRFNEDDYSWLRVEAARRQVPMSKIIAELIDYARHLDDEPEEPSAATMGPGA